jgi:hypothetical protein
MCDRHPTGVALRPLPRFPRGPLGSPLLVAASPALAVAACGQAGRSFPDAQATEEASRLPHLLRLDEAMAAKNVGAADRASHHSLMAALRCRGWEGALEVGHAHLRLGEAVGFRRAAMPRARQPYLRTFPPARERRPPEGVLGAAEGFAALGDREGIFTFRRQPAAGLPLLGGGTVP